MHQHGTGWRRIWWVPPLGRHARICEIGYGAGDFLEEANARGWRVAGMDPAPTMTEVRPWPLARCRAEDYAWPQVPTFHAVVGWQTLEHLDDPATVLGKVRRSLRANGYLVVAVPNTRSLERWLMGERWEGWSPGHHKSFWNAKELSALLVASGFRVEHVLYQRQVKHLPGGIVMGTLLAALGLSGRMTLVARPA
jgi:2-polyprenyl-3-methyl-5-hydroxy-6-metoxy-1,4-benzoquinol methylase